MTAADEDFRLSAGPTNGLTDEFLTDVARAYAAAVARGERPSVAMAEQTGRPITTVHRWVHEARRRGVMPPGSKGRTDFVARCPTCGAIAKRGRS